MTKTDGTKEATKHTPEPWTEEFLLYVSSISSVRETEIPCYRIHPLATPEEYICETNEHLDDEVQYANTAASWPPSMPARDSAPRRWSKGVSANCWKPVNTYNRIWRNTFAGIISIKVDAPWKWSKPLTW
jgi:hypothetical protein